MQGYARLLEKRDCLQEIVHVLYEDLQRKIEEGCDTQEAMQYLEDCRLKLQGLESQIHWYLFGEV